MNVTREQRELVKKAKEFIKQKTEKEETEIKEVRIQGSKKNLCLLLSMELNANNDH